METLAIFLYYSSHPTGEGLIAIAFLAIIGLILYPFLKAREKAREERWARQAIEREKREKREREQREAEHKRRYRYDPAYRKRVDEAKRREDHINMVYEYGDPLSFLDGMSDWEIQNLIEYNESKYDDGYGFAKSDSGKGGQPDPSDPPSHWKQ